MGSALQSSSMKVMAALTTMCLLAAPAMSRNLGNINVKDFGEVFVCAPDWAAGAIQMHDNGFTMNGNSRLYFCNRAVDNWDPNAYWQTPLNNKHFAYTLDLSNVGCHCNAAAYFINMPGSNPVMGITTAMLTSGTTSGAPSTTPWRATSTPSPPPSTPVTGVTDTGTAVTEEAARSMLSMLTPT